MSGAIDSSYHGLWNVLAVEGDRVMVSKFVPDPDDWATEFSGWVCDIQIAPSWKIRKEKELQFKKDLNDLRYWYPDMDPKSVAFLLCAMINKGNQIFNLCRYRMVRDNSKHEEPFAEWDQHYQKEVSRWYDFLKYVVGFDWEQDGPLQNQMVAGDDLETLMYSQKRAMICRFGRA